MGSSTMNPHLTYRLLFIAVLIYGVAAVRGAPAEPIIIARPAELRERSMSGTYQFFLGNLHGHSVFSGDHAKTVATKMNSGKATYDKHQPSEVLAAAKKNRYDFYAITDHSSPEQNEFYRDGFTDDHWAITKQQVRAATTPEFVAFWGYEFSRNIDLDRGGLGHLNVLNTEGWNSAYARGHTFAWLYDWLLTQTNRIAIGQFNHPEMPGTRGKNFKDYEGRTRERNQAMRLVEIWNSNESPKYVAVVKKIWALGWKVAPTANTDVHGVFGVENRRLRTGVLAERLTPEGIMQALWDRRVYATLDPLLHLEFTLNGQVMGAALDKRPPGDLQAKVFVNDPGGSVISRVEIHGGNYESHGGATDRVASLPVGAGKTIVENAVPGGYDFYYVVVFKDGSEEARAFSAPIWMDNE